MVVARRLKFGLAALVALAASVFFAAPALADTQPDPQLTNIPYLAWRGEEVRLVKCEPDVFPAFANGAAAAQAVQFGPSFIDFLLVDWSGDPHLAQPVLETGTVSMFFRSTDGAPCVAGTFVSQKAGLAQIKLVATLNFSQAEGFPVDIPEVITLKHDFNVGWMNINQASLTSLDPTTDVAGGNGNQLQLLINGQIPLLGNYGELGLGDSLTMPDDWAALANVMATFRDPLNPSPAMMWDIHDGLSWLEADVEGHGAQSACDEFPVPIFFDAVDDCGFEDATGPFSRVWDGFTDPTLGPFDPQRPWQTLLSNGVLDAGDAPMPAARVDFAIAPNSGAPGDISGVGTLFPSLKIFAYQRATEHPFYAPFYAQWIPPTYPSIGSFFGGQPPFFVPEASGITGPVNFSRNPADCNGATVLNGIPTGGGNNFNGYLTCGLYLPWLFSKVLKCGPTGVLVNPNDPFGDDACLATDATPSGCLPLVANPDDDNVSGADQPFRPQTAVVYTDEHGEARVFYEPSLEFFFLNLPGVGINANGGCDIANIPGGVLGSASVNATVRYPFEPVTARPVVSNSVVKTVTSLFSKSITCYPKGTQPEERNAAICVAQATDITGAPFVGETVCFFADFNAEDIQYFSGPIPGTSIVIGDEGRNEDAEDQGLRRICPFTDANGRAAVEVFNSNPTTVDVQALFVDEGILRHLIVPFPITGQVGPSSAQSNQTPTTPNQPNQPGGSPSPGTNKPDATPGVKYRIAKFKVNRVGRTKATVLLRVVGPQGKARVRIRFAAAGKQARIVTRTVKANRLVKMKNLRTPNAKRLRASISLVS